jgi:isoleucyl-tRNA synthetase
MVCRLVSCMIKESCSVDILDTELKVTKQLDEKKQSVDPKTLRQLCREYALDWLDRQRTEFKRLGVVADWDHPYLTMSYRYEVFIFLSFVFILFLFC